MYAWMCNTCGIEVPECSRRCACGSGRLTYRDCEVEKRFVGRPGRLHYLVDDIATCVHPSQRAAAEAEAVAIGVPTEFNAAGHAIYRTRGHYNRFLAAKGFSNRSPGYGDTTPLSGNAVQERIARARRG